MLDESHLVPPFEAMLEAIAMRRRIDPARRRARAKGGAERLAEETAAASAAAAAVVQALRHAGVAARPEAIRVQREPFEAKGARAEAFAPDAPTAGSRFAKERLWHMEVGLDVPQRGPLVVGDGRYLGLGLMRPARRTDGVLAFAIEDGLAADADAATLTRALRRAALARVQTERGEGKPLPPYLTGHAVDGTPLREGGAHRHIAFAYDRAQQRLLVRAPHVLDRRPLWQSERESWSLLEEAMRELTELRAGAAGKLRLARTRADLESSALLAPTRHWESATPYRVARHRRLADAAAAVAADIAEECRRLRLPRVDVTVLEARGFAGAGLAGRTRLRFASAVAGPILIGRDHHFGGGLFAGDPSQAD